MEDREIYIKMEENIVKYYIGRKIILMWELWVIIFLEKENVFLERLVLFLIRWVIILANVGLL